MKKFFTILREYATQVWLLTCFLVKQLWNSAFGPCCDKPRPTWNEGPGFSISKCQNCGTTKTYPRSGF